MDTVQSQQAVPGSLAGIFMSSHQGLCLTDEVPCSWQLKPHWRELPGVTVVFLRTDGKGVASEKTSPFHFGKSSCGREQPTSPGGACSGKSPEGRLAKHRRMTEAVTDTEPRPGAPRVELYWCSR